MDNKYLNNAQELKEIFALDEKIYKNYIPLQDCIAGFSVQREYPTNIKYFPPKKADGSPDTVAIIYVVYYHPKVYKSKSKDPNKVPIFLEIRPFDRYLVGRHDYNFNDKESCPTEESVLKSKSTPKPISLETLDEYYYDHATKAIVDSKNRVVSGSDIVERLFKQHCDTVHPLKGLKLRWLLGSRNKLINVLKIFIDALKNLFQWLTGRTLDPEDSMRGFFSPYKEQDIKLTKGDYLEIFGYKASINIIVTFCFLRILLHIYSYYSNTDIPLIKSIENNNISSVSATICILWFLDHVVPLIFLKIINLCITTRFNLMFTKIKV